MSAAAKQVSEYLAKRLGERKYDLWFGPATRFRIDGKKLEVTAKNQRVADWIGANFAEDLRQAAEMTLGAQAVVDVRVDEAPDAMSNGLHAPARQAAPSAVPSPGPARRGEPAGARRPDLSLPLRHRFEDFVVGATNELAFTAATRLAEAPDPRTLGALFIHGECGVGKTHLLQAVCRRHLDRFPGATVRYTTCEQFTNEYIVAVKNNSVEQFRRKVRGLDLLAVDDVHFLSNKTATQNEFLHTLDAIDLSGARLAMASDEHPRHLKAVSRALISRFLAGMVCQIETPDRGTRLALVRRLAERRGLRLNDAAAEQVAAHCVGSVREMEGVLSKLDALCRLEGEGQGEVGCVMIERLFKADAPGGRPLRVNTIIDAVCARLCVERGDLLGKTRHHRVVIARGLISYLARELTTLSFPEIGRALGRRNHSTVLTAGRRVGDQIERNERIDLEDGGEPVPLRELADRLRHDIRRLPRE